MSAVALAVLGALGYGFSAIFTRRAVVKVSDASVGVLISVPLGVLFFAIILIATGQIGSVVSFSWQSYAWLSAAGILHFVVGRSLNYSCIKLAGATISNVLSRASILVAVVLGISVLNEPLTWELVVGVLLIFLGVVTIGLQPQMLGGGQVSFSAIPRKALLIGLGAGVAWGISPILVKLGLGVSVSPVAGVFISYTAATIILGISLLNHDRRVALIGMKSGATGFFFLAGLFSSTAQLLNYSALSIAPASVVTPIFSMAPVFVLFFSFLFNRKLEMFSKAVIIGTIVVVVGGVLLA